jgi:hypothetical protein
MSVMHKLLISTVVSLLWVAGRCRRSGQAIYHSKSAELLGQLQFAYPVPLPAGSASGRSNPRTGRAF